MPLSEGAGGFAALGAALYEQAAGFYADDARRVLQAHAERKQPPPESNARTAFKVENVQHASVCEQLAKFGGVLSWCPMPLCGRAASNPADL